MIIDALDLPKDLTPAWTSNHFANLVVNDYFAQQTAPVDGQTRLLGHIDIGGVTLLSADEAPGGLEVDVDGTWTPVVLPANSYLIQVGDLLRRWTNNLIPGNLHRVVNPPPDVAARAQRLSIKPRRSPPVSMPVMWMIPRVSGRRLAHDRRLGRASVSGETAPSRYRRPLAV